MRRVGHKGAHHIVPGNTRASFDAALAAGVDMIEFDVLPALGAGSVPGPLVLAHDSRDAASRRCETLEEGLAHLADPAFQGIELDVDLKTTGYELAVVEALRAHELVPRTLISTHHASSLRIIREREPRLRLGLSVPNIRHDPFRSPALSVPVYGALALYRAVLPFRVTRAIRSGLCDALMAHFRLVTPRLLDSVHRAGGELYVWTVDEVERVRELERLGVDGVISNDPRILQPV